MNPRESGINRLLFQSLFWKSLQILWKQKLNSDNSWGHSAVISLPLFIITLYLNNSYLILKFSTNESIERSSKRTASPTPTSDSLWAITYGALWVTFTEIFANLSLLERTWEALKCKELFESRIGEYLVDRGNGYREHWRQMLSVSERRNRSSSDVSQPQRN